MIISSGQVSIRK